MVELRGAELRKANTELRNARIAQRFTELYQVQRVRHDDVMHTLGQEFFLTQCQIEKILRRKKPKAVTQ